MKTSITFNILKDSLGVYFAYYYEGTGIRFWIRKSSNGCHDDRLIVATFGGKEPLGLNGDLNYEYLYRY